MKILVIGSSGMLGRSLLEEAKNRQIPVVGASRTNADILFDATEDREVNKLIDKAQADIVINAAALTSIEDCEKDKEAAYRINGRFVSVLSEACLRKKVWLIHISSDHYFIGERDKKHSESDQVSLINEYARTKYIGECFALLNPKALIIRTNIVGFRNKKEKPTFIEWVIQSLKEKGEITLFDDFFTSSIHTRQFAVSLFDLLKSRPRGVLNIASSEVFSKKKFIENIARGLGYSLDYAKSGSIFDYSGVLRAESLGLDVQRAELLLEYNLPDMARVIDSVILEHKRILCDKNA